MPRLRAGCFASRVLIAALLADFALYSARRDEAPTTRQRRRSEAASDDTASSDESPFDALLAEICRTPAQRLITFSVRAGLATYFGANVVYWLPRSRGKDDYAPHVDASRLIMRCRLFHAASLSPRRAAASMDVTRRAIAAASWPQLFRLRWPRARSSPPISILLLYCFILKFRDYFDEMSY